MLTRKVRNGSCILKTSWFSCQILFQVRSLSEFPGRGPRSKMVHHNAFLAPCCRHGNSMDFSRLPISLAVHVDDTVLVLDVCNIVVSTFGEV